MLALQVSLYPIAQENIEKALEVFWNFLKKENINYKVSPLSTITWDEDEKKLYDTIYKAYREARKSGPAVMVTTLASGNKQEIGKLLDFMD